MNRIGSGLGIQAMVEALNEDVAESTTGRYVVVVNYDPAPSYALYFRDLGTEKVIGDLEGEYDPDFKPVTIDVSYNVEWRRLKPVMRYLDLR